MTSSPVAVLLGGGALLPEGEELSTAGKPGADDAAEDDDVAEVAALGVLAPEPSEEPPHPAAARAAVAARRAGPVCIRMRAPIGGCL